MVTSEPVRPAVRGRGRHLLLTAARELFEAKGYGGTSTREIAERAGVTEPMLFRHFRTKANLFQEAAVTPFVEFMDQYMEDYRGRQHGALSAEEEGRRFFEGIFGALRNQRQLLVTFMLTDKADPALSGVETQIKNAFRRVLQLFQEVVSTESTVRGFTDFDLESSVRIMVGMALSLALHDNWLNIEDVTLDRAMTCMTTMAVRGLGIPDEDSRSRS